MPEYTVKTYFNVANNFPATPQQAAKWTDEERDRSEHVPMMDGYRPGDPLTPSKVTIVVNAIDAKKAAERVFAQLNADDRPNGKFERSVSVGDVLYVSAGHLSWSTWLACESVFWKVVAPPSILQYRRHDGEED